MNIANTRCTRFFKKISFTGEKILTINLGSYNYLGFADNRGPIANNVINSIKSEGVATASSTQEFGLTFSIKELNV